MKFLFAAIITILLSAACSPVATSAEEPASSSSEAAVLNENSAAIPEVPLPSIETKAPTAAPLPGITPNPTADAGSTPPHDFSLTQNFYPALSTYFDSDWSETDIRGVDLDSVHNRVAISGCVRVCDRYSAGYAYLLLLDAAQNDPPQALAIDPAARIGDVDFMIGGESLLYSTRKGIMEYDIASNTYRTLYNTTGDSSPPNNDISPDGKLLASDIGGTLVILRLEDLQEVARFEGIITPVYHATYFDDTGDRVLVTRNRDRTVFAVYEIASQLRVRVWDTPVASAAALSVDGKSLAVAPLEGGMVSIVDLASGEITQQIDPHMNQIKTMAYAPASGLLFVSGVADDTSSIFESIRFFDPQTAEEKGRLLTYIDHYALTFAADGASLLAISGPSVGLWSPETDVQRQAANLVRQYINAVVSGDYLQAAEMTRLDDLAVMELEDLGLNPADLVSVFTTLCTDDAVPCLPLGEVVSVSASDGEYWDYEVLVTLEKPDGSIVMFEEIESYEFVGVKADEQGNLYIASLHPGMRFPLP